MKNKIINSLFAIFIIFFGGCGKDNLPTVTTSEVKNITSSSFESGGTISDDGGAVVTERGVCWSITTTPTVDDFKTADGSGAGNFTSIVNKLTPNTNYFVRAYSTNENGTSYGATLAITTIISGPELLLNEISNISDSSSEFNFDVLSDGGAPIIKGGIVFNKIEIETIADGNIINIEKIENSNQGKITNLQPNTKYFVRAFAINEIDTSLSNSVLFTTSKKAPSVDELSVSNIKSKSAEFSARLLSDGGSSVSELGFIVSTQSMLDLDNHEVKVTAETSSFNGIYNNFDFGSVYYLRGYAINDIGVSYTRIIKFETLPWEHLNDFPGDARGQSCSFKINSDVYVGLGDGESGTLLSDFWKYSIDLEEWTKLKDFPGDSRAQAFSFALNGKGYVGSGRSFQKDFWRYDPLMNEWTKMDSLDNFLYGLSFVSEGKAYVLSFFENDTKSFAFYEFDTKANSWTVMKKLETKQNHTHPIFFSYNDVAYVGVNREDKEIYTFDPKNNSWIYLTSFPGTAWSNNSVFVIDKKAYIIGGYCTNEVWSLDLTNLNWIQEDNLPFDKRHSGISFSHNGIGYYGLGVTSCGIQKLSKEFVRFKP